MNGTELNYFEEPSENEVWDECSGDGCNIPTLGGKLCGDCAVEEYQKRIIKLLWANTCTTTSPIDGAVMQSLRISLKDFEALIKGEKQ